MAKKKTDETEETVDATETQAAEDNAAEVTAGEPETETKPKKAASKKTKPAADDDASAVESLADAAVSAVETVAAAVSEGASKLAAAVTGSEDKTAPKGKRAEKIGVVSSDKMTKTVVVRVDRVVKHPVYRKYVRRRKKFMAHDDLGSKIGDKVRIVETRPMSARKRWRVVEIIQKAEV